MRQADTPLLNRRTALAAGLALLSGEATAADRPRGLAGGLRARCDMLARTQALSGAVLLARGDQVLFRGAYGMRNRGEALANRTDTKFNIASIGKLFTSLCVMRFAQAGHLALDQTLAEAWPEYPNRRVAERITIKQMLTHTAGLGNAFLFKPKTGLSPHATHQDYLRLFVDEPLAGEPGGAASYSNDGYILLGALIEHLSGTEFRRYCHDTIFAPLGMSNTSYAGPAETLRNRAEPYVRDLERPGVWVEAPKDDMPASAAGGAHSTVDDLLRFAAALRENRLLSAEMTRTWTEARVDMGRSRYGYGVEVDNVNGHRLIGHSGGHYGVAGELAIFEGQGLTFVALTNGEVDPFWDLANFVKTSVAGESEASRNYAFTLRLIETIKSSGLEAGLALAAANPERRVREGVIDTIALREWHNGDADAAATLLIFNRRQFPQSLSATWSLAEFYRYAGHNADAVAAYRDFLVQQPGDEDALRYIAQLSRQTG